MNTNWTWNAGGTQCSIFLTDLQCNPVDPWGDPITDWADWKREFDADNDLVSLSKKGTINGYNVHTLIIYND